VDIPNPSRENALYEPSGSLHTSTGDHFGVGMECNGMRRKATKATHIYV